MLIGSPSLVNQKIELDLRANQKPSQIFESHFGSGSYGSFPWFGEVNLLLIFIIKLLECSAVRMIT